MVLTCKEVCYIGQKVTLTKGNIFNWQNRKERDRYTEQQYAIVVAVDEDEDGIYGATVSACGNMKTGEYVYASEMEPYEDSELALMGSIATAEELLKCKQKQLKDLQDDIERLKKFMDGHKDMKQGTPEQGPSYGEIMADYLGGIQSMMEERNKTKGVKGFGSASNLNRDVAGMRVKVKDPSILKLKIREDYLHFGYLEVVRENKAQGTLICKAPIDGGKQVELPMEDVNPLN